MNHGEVVVWPAGEPHAAWTEGTEMRAIVVEFTGEDDAWARAVLAGGTMATRVSTPGSTRVAGVPAAGARSARPSPTPPGLR